MGKWLKKYMKIEHLENTLKNKELFLGDPKKWTDKNDGELIDIYKGKKDLADIRVTCLTKGPDRFHFWAIFGERESGVCLWFDKGDLLKDIAADKSLRKGSVCYYTSTQLKKNCSIDGLPFAKREQYRDEQEFRVLREYNEKVSGKPQGIKFNPNSLKRIYFNNWLTEDCYKEKKEGFNSRVGHYYNHVEIFQNKILRFEKWIDAAKCVKQIVMVVKIRFY